MRVFVPWCENLEDERVALRGARLVPYQLNYPVLRAAAADADAPPPRPGEVQVMSEDSYRRSLERRA